jgi:glycerol-3-phosphate cytidylyltransferase
MPENAIKALVDFTDTLDALKIQYVLDGGTALGAIRQQDFCKDDQTDLDITTLAEQRTDAIVYAAMKRGFEVDHITEATEAVSGIIAMKRDGVRVDLQFKRLHQGIAWWVIEQNHSITFKAVPAVHYLRYSYPEYCIIRGRQFPVVNDARTYLEYRYGETWTTPRDDWDTYTMDGAISHLAPCQPYRFGLTFGAFDCLHAGHIALLHNASQLCRDLVVCVSSDDFVYARKGKRPLMSLEARMRILSALPCVDYVCVQEQCGKRAVVDSVKADAIFVGDDWGAQTFDGEGLGVPVVYLPHTHGISSTLISKL